MTENPKKKLEDEPCIAKLEKDDSWEADQRERGYYYDDAHGYEVFIFQDDGEADDEDED